MNIYNLKFLVDVGVGKSIEDFLTEHLYDIKSVRSIDPKMPDQNILKLASKEERIIITMDKDFGELVYQSKMNHSGIILLRLEDATAEEKLKVIMEILNNYSELLHDNFCVYQKRKFRIKEKK